LIVKPHDILPPISSLKIMTGTLPPSNSRPAKKRMSLIAFLTWVSAILVGLGGLTAAVLAVLNFRKAQSAETAASGLQSANEAMSAEITKLLNQVLLQNNDPDAAQALQKRYKEGLKLSPEKVPDFLKGISAEVAILATVRESEDRQLAQRITEFETNWLPVVKHLVGAAADRAKECEALGVVLNSTSNIDFRIAEKPYTDGKQYCIWSGGADKWTIRIFLRSAAVVDPNMPLFCAIHATIMDHSRNAESKPFEITFEDRIVRIQIGQNGEGGIGPLTAPLGITQLQTLSKCLQQCVDQAIGEIVKGVQATRKLGR
jgi:hypothetical protein